MKSHRAESDPGRARGLPVFAREVGHLREAVGRGKTAGGRGGDGWRAGVTSDKLHHEEPAAEIGVLDDRVKAFADEARDLLVRGEVAAEEGLQRVDDDQVGVSIGRFGKLPVQ